MLNAYEIKELKDVGVILIDDLCDNAARGYEPSKNLSDTNRNNSMNYTGFLNARPRVSRALHVTVHGNHIVGGGHILSALQLLDRIKWLLGGLVLRHVKHVQQRSLFS